MATAPPSPLNVNSGAPNPIQTTMSSPVSPEVPSPLQHHPTTLGSNLTGQYIAPPMQVPGYGSPLPSALPGQQANVGSDQRENLPHSGPMGPLPGPNPTGQYTAPPMVNPAYSSPTMGHPQQPLPSYSGPVGPQQGIPTSEGKHPPITIQPGVQGHPEMKYAGLTEEEMKKQRREENLAKARLCLGETCIICGKICVVTGSIMAVVAGMFACMVDCSNRVIW